MKKLRRIEVDWEDSGSAGGWESRKDSAKKDVLLCRSIGYVIRSDEKCIILSQSQCAVGDRVSDTITIPRACVKRVRRL